MSRKKTKIIAWALAFSMLAVNPGTDKVQAAGKADSLKNPVHHCNPGVTKEDTTDWSYVYFGSYPQDGNIYEYAASEADVFEGEYDENGDAWFNGTKWRRIKGEESYLDNFYSKWQRIKWRVMKKDDDSLLLVADKALDARAYNDTLTETTWETSSMRKWLNDEFYNMAFSQAEKKAILETTLSGMDNEFVEDHIVSGGNSTTDKVWLLSLSEAMSEEYGFCEGSAASSGRNFPKSAYATKKTSKGSAEFYEMALRTPGVNPNSATGDPDTYYVATMRNSGSTEYGGRLVDEKKLLVLPVIRVKLDAAEWALEDDGTSGGEPRTVTGVSMEKTEVSVKPGQHIQLKASVLPATASNKKLKWYSRDESLVTVDDNGYVTAKQKEGDINVYAVSEEGGFRRECAVIVSKDAPEEEKPTSENPGDKPSDKPSDKPNDKPADNDLKIATIKGVEYTLKEEGAVVSKVTSKTIKKADICNTVTIKDKKYPVVAIEKNAFSGCKNLASVTIPANIKKIGGKAFYNCKKLNKITIKTTKLKTSNVGSNAFKGIAAKATIKVPKAKLKDYKKLLKKRGVSGKAKIKK